MCVTITWTELQVQQKPSMGSSLSQVSHLSTFLPSGPATFSGQISYLDTAFFSPEICWTLPNCVHSSTEMLILGMLISEVQI